MSYPSTVRASGLGALFQKLTTLALERLHLLKKDASQIGINAREAVKFLDRVTSGKDGLNDDAIALQGPDEQYMTWKQVEEHLIQEDAELDNRATGKEEKDISRSNGALGALDTVTEKTSANAGGALSQMLLSKLNFAKDPDTASTSSTPPTSPLSSGPQSSKTSPEVKSAKLAEEQASIVPPVFKPLLNSVVWYTYQKSIESKGVELVFLTNSAEIASLARSFGLAPKNIYQLRTVIGLESQEVKNRSKYEKKHPSPPSTASPKIESEPKPLFKYEEDSDEEIVVFKPRGRGMRGTASARGSPATSIRAMNGHQRSPIPGFSSPSSSGPQPRELPTEEIDPDSFDRGSFGRGSTPLANTTPHLPSQFQGFHRGTPARGNFVPAGPGRGNFTPTGPGRGNFSPASPGRGGFWRGAPRGFDRGSVRGRGRLFVP